MQSMLMLRCVFHDIARKEAEQLPSRIITTYEYNGNCKSFSKLLFLNKVLGAVVSINYVQLLLNWHILSDYWENKCLK